MHTIVQKMGYSENTEVKFVEPNKGRHIAVAGDMNTIVASKTGRLELREQLIF
jgi:hypothetical protein